MTHYPIKLVKFRIDVNLFGGWLGLSLAYLGSKQEKFSFSLEHEAPFGRPTMTVGTQMKIEFNI